MEALILCGGFATRLEPITLFVPKPLLPIHGKPILDYIIDDIGWLNLNRIVISSNKKFVDQFEYWRANKIASGLKTDIDMVMEATVSNGEKFGAIKGIQYAIDTANIDDDLLIVAGDNYYNFSLDSIVAHFKDTHRPTIGLFDIGSLEGAKRFGVVTLKGDKVADFKEKPEKPDSTLISTGIYLFPKDVLQKFKEYLEGQNNPDAPGYFVQWLIKNTELDGFVYKGEWFDIGTIDTYKKAFDEALGLGEIHHGNST